VHSLEQRVAETVEWEQTVDPGFMLQTRLDAVSETLHFPLGARPLSARLCGLDQRRVRPEVVRKTAGLHAAKLWLRIEDGKSSLKFSALIPSWSNSLVIWRS
jgi:hypothetical protein